MSTTRLYIVADEALIGRELSARVTQLGYEVCGQAARGAQALEETPRIRPALVLMAVGLAGEWNGLDTAARLRPLLAVPILFLSAPSEGLIMSHIFCWTPDEIFANLWSCWLPAESFPKTS